KVYQFGQVLTFTPDGKRLAVHVEDQRTYDLQVCDAATGKVLATAPLPHDNVKYATAFSADGGTLAIAGLDEDVVLWQVGVQAKLRKMASGIMSDGVYPIRCLAFSPDGTKLLVASGSGLQLLDVASGTTVQPWPGHAGPVEYLAFSADGRRLVTGGVHA